MRALLIILVMGLSINLFGQKDHRALVLNEDNIKDQDITSFCNILIDESGELSIEEILAENLVFNAFDTVEAFTYPTTHWLKLNVISHLDSLDKWIIFTHPIYKLLGDKGYIDAYHVKDGTIKEHHRSGVFVPKREKTIKERALVDVVPLKFESPDTMTIYMRVQDVRDPYSTHISLSLIDPNPFISNTSDKFKLEILGSFGAYLIIGFYILFFYFATKKKAYLYFALFALLNSFHYLFIDPQGRFIDTFLPNQPHLGPFLFMLISFSYTLLLLFGRYFTDLPNRHPKWDRYLILITIIITTYAFYIIINNYNPPFTVRTPIYFVVIILIFPLCIQLMKDNHFQSRVFAIGIFWLAVWNSLGMLWNFGFIQLPFIPWTVGQVGFLLIYGIGLGLDLMYTEKEKANAKHIIELDGMKSKFFANISHEFRTPLSLILGPINQVYESIPSSESIENNHEFTIKAKHLNVMKKNALRLQNLVDQLLDLSKLDSGKMNLQLVQGNMIQFIKSLVYSFESLADRNHIQFNTSFPTDIENAYYDADKLEKILVNILSNAFKFTPDHGIVSVTVEENGSGLKILISDSGKGIAKEELNMIFNRFYQTEGTEAKGTGIGLALVKELVELHEGVISVSSTYEHGTTFRIILPYRLDQFEAHELDITSPDIKPNPILDVLDDLDETYENKIENKSKDLPLILLAEDNVDLRQFIADGLKASYNVIVITNGKEALDKAVVKIPDLVVSDVMMPKMDGFELCAALKTNEKTSHIPVILLTAKAGIENKIQGLQYGADDYLTKPFDMRELRTRIKNLIDQRQILREKFHTELQIRPTKIVLNSVDERFLKAVMSQIEGNISNEYYTVEDLAESVNFSRSQLNRKIKALTNKTTNQLIREFRLTRAKEILEQHAASISEVAYEVGYSNLSYFSKSFKEIFGILPSEVNYKS